MSIITIYLTISTQPTQCPQHHPEAAQSKASGSSHRSSGGSGDAPGSSGDEGGHQEQLGAVEQHHQGLGLQLGHQYIDKQRKGTLYDYFWIRQYPYNSPTFARHNILGDILCNNFER